MKTMVSTAASGLPGALDRADVLPAGAKAGPWIVERELGRGGMGAVYAVVHDEIGKRAALKIIHQRLLGPGVTGDRILLEARVVNQVGHPNIVDIFETGKLADGRPYIVMERLDGQALSTRADAGALRPELVVAILLQVCDALLAAHGAGVVHRDLKLDNVFLVDNPDDPETPKVKLLDWGIAKVMSADARHTIDGQLVGTPQYLSPEQARGLEVSPQTDVYSLGVMAYELFLQKLPFEAETAAEVMAMHLRATPPPPCERWPDVPPPLQDLLLAMLAKQPDQRPPVAEVARRLGAVGEELARRRAGDAPRPVTEPPSAAPSPPRAATEPARWTLPSKRWQYAVGACALAATAAMVWVSRIADRAVAAALHPELVPELLAPGQPDPSPERTAWQLPPNALDSAPDSSRREAPRAATTAAQRPDVQRPRAGARAAASRAISSTVARSTPPPRLTASRPAPAHAPPVAPRRGDKVDPDGTLDAYQ